MKKSKKYSASQSIKPRKKLILISIIVLLLFAVGAFAYYRSYKDADGISGDPSSGINYGPPSQQDVTDTENHKKDLSNEQNQPSSPSSTGSKKSVKPVVASYGQTNSAVKVSGRVPGIFEDSGTCTLTMTKGSSKVTGTREASQNVNEMSCGFISIDRSKLSAGAWSASISYNSDGATGTSSPITISVK